MRSRPAQEFFSVPENFRLRFFRNCTINKKHLAGVMELADVTDSKSVGLITRVGSSPTTGTNKKPFLSAGQERFFVSCFCSIAGYPDDS